jgi:hypothetical protein
MKLQVQWAPLDNATRPASAYPLEKWGTGAISSRSACPRSSAADPDLAISAGHWHDWQARPSIARRHPATYLVSRALKILGNLASFCQNSHNRILFLYSGFQRGRQIPTSPAVPRKFVMGHSVGEVAAGLIVPLLVLNCRMSLKARSLSFSDILLRGRNRNTSRLNQMPFWFVGLQLN